jgi:hypothetical protein
LARARRNSGQLAADRTDLDAPVAEHRDSTWFLATVGLVLLCIYLAILNIQGWLQLEAVCEVAMSKDALTLCLQYGAR